MARGRVRGTGARMGSAVSIQRRARRSCRRPPAALGAAVATEPLHLHPWRGRLQVRRGLADNRERDVRCADRLVDRGGERRAARGSGSGPRRAGRAAAEDRRLPGLPRLQRARHRPLGRDQSAWNQDVSRAPDRPATPATTSTRITGLGGNQVVHPDFGGNGGYGIPYTTVGRDQRRVRVNVTGYPDESDFGLAPIPPDAPIEGGSDRHVLVLQRHRCDLFEMFDARYVGGPGHRWSAGSTARFDLALGRASPRRLDLGRRGGPADPARPGALRRGRARAASATRSGPPSPRPAAPTSTRPPTTPRAAATPTCRPWACGCGCRRAYYQRNLHRFPAAARRGSIFEALYRYGIIVADNGGGPTGSSPAPLDPRWDDDDLNRLKDVPGTAFVVVDSRGARQDALLRLR